VASKRRKAREIALKVLYQVDLIGKNPLESFDQVLEEDIVAPGLEALANDFLGKTTLRGSEDLFASAGDFVEEILSLRKKENPADLIQDSALKWLKDEAVARELTSRCLSKIASFAAVELFASELVQKTVQHLEKIDDILAKFADNWSLDRMATLDRSILRFAVCELLFFRDIPVNVTINEAVELSKKYSTERSREFVNGILDKVQRELKPEKDDPRHKGTAEKHDSDTEEHS